MEEYCSGGDLITKMKSVRMWAEQKVAILIKEILIALQYCHKLKIVHRDIKAENIVFENETTNSPIKLIDFGISLRLRQDEILKNTAGSVRLKYVIIYRLCMLLQK